MNQPATSQLEHVEALIAPLIEEAGLELYDCTLTTQRGQRVLRVAVDRPGGTEPGEGVQLEELVELNREISAVLDVEDPISGRYRLDVESPGVERSLRRPWHYERATGQAVHVVLYEPLDGRTSVDGELVSVSENSVTIETKKGQRYDVPLAMIKKANTVYEW